MLINFSDRSGDGDVARVAFMSIQVEFNKEPHPGDNVESIM